MNTALRVVLTGGGSGGPTTPLIAIFEELQNRGSAHTLFLGTQTGPERKMAEAAGIPFRAIPSGKLRRYWSWQNLRDPFRILAGGLIGGWQLRRFQPHVVVSAGSFVSVPIAYAAKILGIPHIFLQMDVRPSLANRLMSPVSQAMAYYFAPSVRSFSGMAHCQQIGPVVRASVRESLGSSANQQFGLDPSRPVLLVTGGGQGSMGLNQAVATILPYWLERFQVVHLIGQDASLIEYHHPGYQVHEFVTQGMGDLLARSDLVVTRAGLGIIGELAALGKDAVLVPIPGTHQEENAQFLKQHHTAAVLSQTEFQLNGLTWWKQFYQTYQPGMYGSALAALLPQNGTEQFVDLILQHCQYP